MARVIRSPQAKRDIVEILAFTKQRWAAEQAASYADLIQIALVTIAADPHRGKLREDIRPGIRSLHIQRPGRPARHILFYRVTPSKAVEIVRLLHDAMDFERHLP